MFLERARAEHGDDTYEALVGACDDPQIPPVALEKYLADTFDVPIAANTLRRHRRRLTRTGDFCRCDR